MDYRIYDCTTNKVVKYFETLLDMIAWFNGENYDFSNCLMQEYNITNNTYRAIGW